MVEWSQGNTVDDTRPKAKRRGLVGKIMKKKLKPEIIYTAAPLSFRTVGQIPSVFHLSMIS